MEWVFMLVGVILAHVLVKLVMEFNIIPLFRILQHCIVDISGGFSIVNCPVVVFQVNIQLLGQSI